MHPRHTGRARMGNARAAATIDHCAEKCPAAITTRRDQLDTQSQESGTIRDIGHSGISPGECYVCTGREVEDGMDVSDSSGIPILTVSKNILPPYATHGDPVCCAR